MIACDLRAFLGAECEFMLILHRKLRAAHSTAWRREGCESAEAGFPFRLNEHSGRIERPIGARTSELGAVSASMLLVALPAAGGMLVAAATSRLRARRRRRYVRLRIALYRTDRATAEAVVGVFEGLHTRLLQRWWRRLLVGQPSVALEAHLRSDPGGEVRAELAVSCPEHKLNAVEAALRSAYPNTQLEPFSARLARPPHLLRLKKRSEFITRLRVRTHENPNRL